MMKKVFLTLGLGCLAFSLESAAFRRVGAFASKVVFSKVGAAAGVVAVYNGAKSWHALMGQPEIFEKYDSFLDPEIDVHLQAFFKRRGIERVKCLQVDDIPMHLSAVKGYNADHIIFFGNLQANILMSPNVKIHLENGEVIPCPIKELLACLEHEVGHLKYPDAIEREILKGMSLPLALLAAKAARVSGKSKLASIGLGLGYFTAHSCLYVARKCMQEKRCDLNTSSSDSARCFANYCANNKKIMLGGYLLHQKRIIEEALANPATPLSEKLLLQGKLCGVAVHSACVDLGIITLEHFPVSMSASYLEEHAKKLEKTEQPGVVSDVQKTADAIEKTLIRLIEEEAKAKS